AGVKILAPAASVAAFLATLFAADFTALFAAPLVPPSLISGGPAPAEAVAQVIAAPVPARAVPADGIPAVLSSLVHESDLLHQVEAVDGDAGAGGRAKGRRLRRSAHQHSARQGGRRGNCKCQATHGFLPRG